jgi:hypothetical protein
MTLPTIDTAHPDDDVDARIRRISDRILDGIEETLTELAQPRVLGTAIEGGHILDEARRAVQARYAALLCPQARCRRANRCRRQPCVVPASAFDRETTMQGDRGR